MKATIGLAIVVLGLCHLTTRVQAESACTCVDMLDLVNRTAEAQAAIAQYEAEIQAWEASGNSPAGNDSNRQLLQGRVQTAINAVSNPKANRSGSETDGFCNIVNRANTACMKEVTQQHEFVHRNACQADRIANQLSVSNRFSSSRLAGYAKEEVASYRAELAYVTASLTNLERDCRFSLEFRSTIYGTLELAKSEAEADVDLAVSPTLNLAYRGLGGRSDKLKYKTKDTGPPKVQGGGLLAQLVTACYTTYEGSGTTTIDIADTWTMRENTAPFAPRIELLLAVGATNEAQKTKGPRGCPRASTAGSFWSQKFLIEKTFAAPNRILVDDWTFQPRAGVFAEAKLTSTCGAIPANAPVLASIGVAGFCIETTTLTLRERK